MTPSSGNCTVSSATCCPVNSIDERCLPQNPTLLAHVCVYEAAAKPSEAILLSKKKNEKEKKNLTH